MIKRINIAVFLVILIKFTCPAQDLELNTRLEKDSALIGKQINYVISVRSEKPLHSIVPLDDKLFPQGIEVISSKYDSVVSKEYREYMNEYLITSFDSGVYSINMIPVLVNNYRKLDTLFTSEITLVIYSPEVDTTADINDIKNPVNTPFTLSELKPFLPYAGGVLLVLSAILIFFYFQKNKKYDAEEIRKLPAHIKALEALDRIKDEKLWQKGQVKEYYSKLSDTVRIYIEERYQIPAMESVTGEILDSFKKYSWDDDNLMEILESLLQLSDLVKFAKEDPSPSENETNLNNAYIFIEKTKPVETIETHELS